MKKDNKTIAAAIMNNPQQKPYGPRLILDLYVYTKQLLILANDLDDDNTPPIIMSDFVKEQGERIIRDLEAASDKPKWKYRAGQQSFEAIFCVEAPEIEQNGFHGSVSIEGYTINGSKAENASDLEKPITEYLESILFQ